MPFSAQITQMLQDILFLLPIILIAMSFHEFAHGYVSYKLGDPTPKVDGRLSLNPLHHIDPIGFVFLLLFRFGWAKPVMVNPQYYKKPKRDMALVALAGPVMNFILAFFAMLVWVILQKLQLLQNGDSGGAHFIALFIAINIGLGIFNLLPAPPLDGSKVLGFFLPEKLYVRYLEKEYLGFMVVILLLATGVIDPFLRFARSGLMQMFLFVSDKVTFFL